LPGKTRTRDCTEAFDQVDCLPRASPRQRDATTAFAFGDEAVLHGAFGLI